MKPLKNKEFYNYYAIAIESSYYVNSGALVKINKNEVEKVKKDGVYEFPYTFNMHFETDKLKCVVVKETISKTYEILK